MFKYKKISFLMVMFLSIGFTACSNQQQTETQAESKKTVVSDKVDNKIKDVDLGILTREEFEKAILKGKEYKGKKTEVENINMIVRTEEEFKKDWGKAFIITTPYTQIVGISKSITEKYLEANEETVCKELKTMNLDLLNQFLCSAYIGGDSIDFIKDVHMVLKVYGTEEKILQPKQILRDNPNGDPKYLIESPKYGNYLMSTFDAKEIQKLNPKQIEIIVIYPNGKELKQKFEYSKLNQL